MYACNQSGSTETSSTAATDGYVDSINRFCADTSMPNDLCSQLPFDINEKFGNGYSSTLDPKIQPPFDIFSWQTFVALNWPADNSGNPVGKSIGDNPDAQRVWEYYKDASEVFDTESPLKLELQNAKNNNVKYFYRTSKTPHPVDSLGNFSNSEGYPLIDRNLNFAVFEVSINPVEADFITANNLTTKAGIAKAGKAPNPNKPHQLALTLPSSSMASKQIGSMEIKTCWRILDSAKGDILSRYYTRDAVISIAAKNSISNKAFTIKAKVGLVGMHIIRKTTEFGNWIWSTFEQVDNTADNLQQAQNNLPNAPKYPYSFYYPQSLGLQPNNPADTLPGEGGTYKFDTVAPYAKRYAVAIGSEHFGQAVYGTQAVRMFPVYYRTEEVNNLWRSKLKGTVWENYKLIGTQWATSTLTPGKGLPAAPGMLGNTTLETFELNNSSCVSCHNFASVKYGLDNIKTDFSFLIALHSK
jgi:hypothetical protein